jgi:hypothetical protein
MFCVSATLKKNTGIPSYAKVSLHRERIEVRVGLFCLLVLGEFSDMPQGKSKPSPSPSL